MTMRSLLKIFLRFRLFQSVVFEQKGFIISMIAFSVVVIMLGTALSMSSLIFYRQKIYINSVASTQSYYAAEAGLEDAALRLQNNPQMPAISYSISVNGALATISIASSAGGVRDIIAKGSYRAIEKNMEASYRIDTQYITFGYGIQAGTGGIFMDNNSSINGSAFSNGHITGPGAISENATVAGNGNYIYQTSVGGSVLAHSCYSPTIISNNLTYVQGGIRTCSVGRTVSVQVQEIDPQPLPISQSQINGWKNRTTNGAAKLAYIIESNQTATENSSVVITGDMVVPSNSMWNLGGTTKIIGNLTVSSNAKVSISGTLYVTGNLTVSSNATVRLDTSYGLYSGVIVSDGIIQAAGNIVFDGSGQNESRLLIISTSTSQQAISVDTASLGGIFYAGDGGVIFNAVGYIGQLAGYKITVNNGRSLAYNMSLSSISVASKSGSSGQIIRWEEK